MAPTVETLTYVQQDSYAWNESLIAADDRFDQGLSLALLAQQTQQALSRAFPGAEVDVVRALVVSDRYTITGETDDGYPIERHDENWEKANEAANLVWAAGCWDVRATKAGEGEARNG